MPVLASRSFLNPSARFWLLKDQKKKDSSDPGSVPGVSVIEGLSAVRASEVDIADVVPAALSAWSAVDGMAQPLTQDQVPVLFLALSQWSSVALFYLSGPNWTPDWPPFQTASSYLSAT